MDDEMTLIERAFLAGFKCSSEGFNGEYPFHDGKYSDNDVLKELLMVGGVPEIIVELQALHNPWRPIETVALPKENE